MFKKNKFKSSVKKRTNNTLFLPSILILSFLLIIFNKSDYFIVDKLKIFSTEYINPITKIISTPINLVKNISFKINNIKNIQFENLKLKEEVIRLKKWQILAIKNSRENKVFKQLLNSTSHNVEIIKTASVVNQSPGIYSKLITINAGSNFNLTKDLAAINEKGLVGKIILTSKNNSRILLINDTSSSIPVKSLSGGSYSILSGTNNGKFLKSAFTKDNKLPKVGDLLVTSGNAKIFPRDILVARVIKVYEDHYIALPYVDFNNLNYVQIVKSK